jgi:glycosyltransferase involved in cell wall biosynthesis
MNQSKVAVALTVYNRADLIKETFEGLRKQTLARFYVYLCYDGSTDNILEVVQDYADLNIVLCPYSETTSVGSAKNKAVTEALKNNHQYIQILDSDDIPQPEMLEENSKRLDQGDVDWVVCWSHTFGANSGTVRSQIKSLEEQCNKNYLHSWVMAKKEVFEKENFRLDLNGIDDWDWSIRVYKAGFKGAIVEKELHLYRIHPGRVSETTGSISLFPELRKKVRIMNGISDIDVTKSNPEKGDLYAF